MKNEWFDGFVFPRNGDNADLPLFLAPLAGGIEGATGAVAGFLGAFRRPGKGFGRAEI
jgi:hypothetical protein